DYYCSSYVDGNTYIF
nr:immunoglobulin light chain junction region [Macaca mulatta]